MVDAAAPAAASVKRPAVEQSDMDKALELIQGKVSHHPLKECTSSTVSTIILISLRVHHRGRRQRPPRVLQRLLRSSRWPKSAWRRSTRRA